MKTFKSWWDKYKMEGIWDYEGYYEAGWEAASDEFKTLEEENTKLRNLLSQWGRHLEGCGWVSPLVNGEYKKRWVGGCTCGYKKATEQVLK